MLFAITLHVFVLNITNAQSVGCFSQNNHSTGISLVTKS